MINDLRNFFNNTRVIFVIDGCHHCRIWKKFIERENLNLHFSKRISVVNSTLMAEQGIYSNYLLKIFDKYIQDPPNSGVYSFPVLFIDGNVIRGGNTPEEAINYMRGLLYNDYIEEPKGYEFNKECAFRKINGQNSLFCSGELDD